MLHKLHFEAIDHSLRDICGKDLPMGGLTFVLSGDFRQILLAITGAGLMVEYTT